MYYLFLVLALLLSFYDFDVVKILTEEVSSSKQTLSRSYHFFHVTPIESGYKYINILLSRCFLISWLSTMNLSPPLNVCVDLHNHMPASFFASLKTESGVHIIYSQTV